MNQSGSSDSKPALDVAARLTAWSGMLSRPEPAQNLQFLVLERREETCNVARYYVLSIEPTLFGEASLVREWGRIGTRGRRLVELQGTTQLAAESLDRWLARKTRRKYCQRP